MPGFERIIKSIRNRAKPAAMLARGSVARALMPMILKGGGRLSVGRNVDFVVYGDLQVGRGVTLSSGCAIEVGPRGRLVLGDGVFIGRGTVISSQSLIEIGPRVLIAEHCTIRDQDHQLGEEARLHEVGVPTKPVVISENAWIAAGARILKGSRIGKGSVIGANAVVRGDIPPGVVAAGVPVRVIRAIE